MKGVIVRRLGADGLVEVDELPLLSGKTTNDPNEVIAEFKELMGADNQAERVIARMEWREHLAEVFHQAFRKEQDLAPPWNGVSDKHRRGFISGINAVIQEIDRQSEPVEWEWTCGHTAKAMCAECYRLLAVRAHELTERLDEVAESIAAAAAARAVDREGEGK